MITAICLAVLAICAHGRVVLEDTLIGNNIFVNKVVVNTNGTIAEVDLHIATLNMTNNKIPGRSSTDDELENTIDSESEPCGTRNVDTGTPLILTPFIKEGRISEARAASSVDPKLFLGFESYSGFFTVNETYNSNLFFWYFPVVDKPVNETPWLIWLQGGPGVSSLVGLFDEMGPFTLDSENKLKRNDNSWLQNHSLVFIDNPVGTGYSFTDHNDGYAKDMATCGSHMYSAVKQLIQIFPELRVAPLFVAGESYAGKYVPALAAEIHHHKNNPGADINLQGLILGNAYVDPSMVADLPAVASNIGMLQKEQLDQIQPLQSAFQQDIAAHNSTAAKYRWSRLIIALLLMTHQNQMYNFLQDDLDVGKFVPFLGRSDVKSALHVGDIEFQFVSVTVNSALAPDFLTSSKPILEELLDHYRVLAYCGQLDLMVPCVGSSANYRTWKWAGTAEFLQAPRLPYYFHSKLAGYQKTGGRFTEMVIRGAGHMVPRDTPGFAQHMVAQWTSGTLHNRRSIVMRSIDSYINSFVRNSSNFYL